MKKIVSLVVAVVLIMSLAIPAFAAQPNVAEPQACNHDWNDTPTTLWEKNNEETCKKTDVLTRVCRKCAEVKRVEEVSYPYHGETVSKATCDGTTQTHIYSCPNCSAYRYTDWEDCPGASKSHKNGCLWLPV